MCSGKNDRNYGRLIPTIIIFLVIAGFNLLLSCQTGSTENNLDKQPCSDKPFFNSEDDFDFVVIADRTNGLRDDAVADAVTKINLLNPDLVISVGDLIMGYNEDTIRLNYEWEEWESLISPLKMKFFAIPGNHDISNKTLLNLWEQKFGESYYHFVYKDVLFLCMNTEENVNTDEKFISKKQTDYFIQKLKTHKNVKWTFVFMHRPIFDRNDLNWRKLQSELQKRKHTVFTGHTHKYDYKNIQGNDYITMATTGGGSGNFRGLNFGEFDHITHVSVVNGKPSILNIKLSGVFDKYVNLPSTRKLVRQSIPEIHYDIKPLFQKDSTQSKYSSFFEISNESEIKIEYSLDFFYHPEYRFQMDLIESTLMPGETKYYPLEIEKLDNSITKPIELNFQFNMIDSLTNTKLEETYHYQLKPIPAYNVVVKNKKYNVDGDLSEWGDLPYSIQGDNIYGEGRYDGIKDISANFGIAASDDSIYIGVEVIDDHVFVDPKLSYHQQDAILILLDGRPLSVTSMNKSGYFFPVLYL
jgi:predicted phosphodiesterase